MTDRLQYVRGIQIERRLLNNNDIGRSPSPSLEVAEESCEIDPSRVVTVQVLFFKNVYSYVFLPDARSKMHQNKHSAVMNTDLGDGAVNPIPDLGACEGCNEASAERSQPSAHAVRTQPKISVHKIRRNLLAISKT
jgi:hypothetical protein